MPLSHSPCCPSPEVKLLKRRVITAADAANRLREFFEAEAQTEAPELVTTGPAQVTYSQLRGILQRLENDWVDHSEVKLLNCFVEVDAHVEMHMHPCYLGSRLKQGLRKAAGDILLKYHRALGCIPLTMAEFRPAGSRHGALVGDTPYVHFVAVFKALGFSPRGKQWLLGRVSPTQPWAKGMNVNILDLININVGIDALPRELRYDRPSKAWLKDDDPLSEKYLVMLQVTKIDTAALRVGDMGIQVTGCVTTTGHIRKVRQNKVEVGAVPDPDSVAATPPVDTTPRIWPVNHGAAPSRQADTPRTKRKREEKEEEETPNGSAVNGDEEPRKKKKKKR